MHRTLLPFLLLAAGACSRPPPATAFQVTSREQLVGGRRALGDVGDFKISNGVVHAIVQNVGYSRGFGAFGGSLIDVDLVRGGRASGTQGVRGNDWFTEMFPAFFLEAIEPDKVEVVADGKDGGPAIIRVSGRGADFISITKPVNDTLLPSVPLDYTVDYVLEPGKQYLKIVTTMTNPEATKPAGFPLSIPLGFVTLLGEGQRLFVPGEAGFDMRFHLDDVYKRPAALDALPGVVADYWATEGEGVSYALAASPRGASYLSGNPTYYPGAKRDSLLIPIASSSFLGSFWGKPPPELPAKGSYTFVGYLAVGQGDVSTAAKVIFDIADEGHRQPTKYGTVSGRVREAGSNNLLDGVSVVLQNDQGLYMGQARTQNGGIYQAVVPPGHYRAYATDGTRSTVVTQETVEVSAGEGANLDVQVEQPATLSVMVRDGDGRALPAKVSVEGVYDYQGDGPPRGFLYNLRVGERLRPSDLDTDQPDQDATRRYLERIFYAPHGVGTRLVRPGKYKVYASRGPEYDLAVQEVELVAGKTTHVGLVLNHVLSKATQGWVSGDFHVHSINSVDSPMDLPDRVTSYSVEGVDFITATDHNYVSDFQPTIDALGLGDWLRAGVGLELTSLEMGHFNAFPIELQPGPVTHGSFGWFRRPPGELFGQLRALGKDPQKTVVQINHPRDSVLGYFNAFNLGTYTLTTLPDISPFSLDRSPNADGSMGPYDQRQFSLDFDAIEVFNGKRENMRFTYRIPATPPATGPEPTAPPCPVGPITFDCVPAPGEVLHNVINVTDAQGATTKVLQPAFPGALDDWFNLLARGHRFTATGNSDSHGKGEEAGLPRSWLAAGATSDGSMRGLSEDAVYDAMRRGQVVVSNGPFVQLWVNDQPMGSTVVAPSGSVDVRVLVQAAPWIAVDRVVIRRGGKDMVGFPETLAEIPVTATGTVDRLDATHHFDNVPDDSFFVVEVFGDLPMWPVYTPLEVPSILISDAVAVMGGSFGFGSKFGKYRPEQITQVKPYAFTNPVYVTRTVKSSLRAPKRVLPVGASQPWTPRKLPDLRRLFGAFHADVD